MRITRVVGTKSGSLKAPGCMIESSFSPDACIVQSESAELAFYKENADTLFLKQKEWTLTEKNLTRYAIEGTAIISTRRTVDGERTFVENAKDINIGTAYEGKIVFAIGPDERILGLGQHEDGVANYRNVTQHLYQNNMQIPMPVFLSTAGYAVFFDANCLMVYEEHDNQITITLDAAEQIDYYVIEADSMTELVKAVRRMTGKAELLPLWAYGYVQSKERYKTQEEILSVADEFAKREIPVSCIVQDWLSWGKNKWGDKHLDKERYPNLKEMTDKLHEQGIGFMFSVWPNINKGGEDNLEMMEAGKLYANLSTYDAFDEEARALYWKQCEREIFSGGTDAWWCDSTEPFTPDWNGSVKKAPEERYELAKESLTRYMDARMGNVYALFHAKGIYENQKAADASKRVINLTRSGSPASQRYGTVLWSGDILASWDTLKNQIVEGLQMACSAIPYWTLDIGAFFVGNHKAWMRWSGAKEGTQPWFWNGLFEDGNEDKGYRELYTRWLQYGTFLPMMRSHGTDTSREPWRFGEPGTVYYDTICKYIRLRYRLIPYIYSLAADVYHNDAMIMKPLVFDYPADARAAACTDQYLFGDFMVCPVTEAMEYGPQNTPLSHSKTRNVWLPEGIWYDYETGVCLEGGQEIEADAPIEKMPLYVRGGSLIPTDVREQVNLYEARKTEAVTLEIYGGRDGEFVYYQDAGNGYEYQNGEYTKIALSWKDSERKLTLVEAEGSYSYPVSWNLSYLGMDGNRIEKTVTYGGIELVIEF